MIQLVLFDLGDTLFYRDKPLIDFDVDLIHEISKTSKESIKQTINLCLEKHIGIYKFSEDRAENIEAEDQYNYLFFEEVFSLLGMSNKELLQFISKRNSEIRYKLYPDTIKLLQELKEKGYGIGIITNGRPSRRRIVDQLKLTKYIDNRYFYISDEIGFSKPNPAIYQYINEHSGNKRMVICDDEDQNLVEAKTHGWSAIKVDHNKNGFSNIYKQLINL